MALGKYAFSNPGYVYLDGGLLPPLTTPRYGVYSTMFNRVIDKKFHSWGEALDFAEKKAKATPGVDYYVIYLDTKVRGEKPAVNVTHTMDF